MVNPGISGGSTLLGLDSRFRGDDGIVRLLDDANTEFVLLLTLLNAVRCSSGRDRVLRCHLMLSLLEAASVA
jgi:hypothetical protein